jgi:hypothetical protein
VAAALPPTRVEGTLVLAHARDGADLAQFAQRTHPLSR